MVMSTDEVHDCVLAMAMEKAWTKRKLISISRMVALFVLFLIEELLAIFSGKQRKTHLIDD